MAVTEMDYTGGESAEEIYAFASGTGTTISASGTTTVNITTETMLSGSLTLAYYSSGYFRVKKNDVTLYNSTTKATHCVFLRDLKNGDVVKFETDSTQTGLYWKGN